MKKIFAKLAMALCLTAMVSCGGSDNGGGAMSPQQAAQKVMEIEAAYNQGLMQAMQADDAELFVKAVEKYNAAANELAPKVQNLDENKVDPELKQDVERISSANASMFESAQRQFYSDLDDQQKERFNKAMGISM